MILIFNYSLVLCVIYLASRGDAKSFANECIHRDYGNGGTVCVCNATYCDSAPRIRQKSDSDYVSYTSNKAGLRFFESSGIFGSAKPPPGMIVINPSIKEQTIHGWGGAFTDSVGINVKSLHRDAQDKLLKSYFTEDGIEYSLCRVPIEGTDFSTRSYSYNDGAEDPDLTRFALQHEDYLYKIPLIKKAMELTNNELELFASVWNAPPWMKSSNGTTVHEHIKEQFYQTWANYILKFFQQYKKEGIPFWGVTTGNEPVSSAALNTDINNVQWAPVAQGNWVANNLGPTLRNSEFSNITIIAGDDQRFIFPCFIEMMFDYSNSSQYIDGIGVHWYFDYITPESLLNLTHHYFPDKFILATEACEGSLASNDKRVLLGSWQRGEIYMSNIFEDLNNWVTGWIDWNLALNTTGGPTFIDNRVDSPIIINATFGEFYKQPMYYALGHFSKFVPKGSIKLGLLNTVGFVKVLAFLRPDDSIAVVAFNPTGKATLLHVAIKGKGLMKINVSANSFNSIIAF